MEYTEREILQDEIKMYKEDERINRIYALEYRVEANEFESLAEKSLLENKYSEARKYRYEARVSRETSRMYEEKADKFQDKIDNLI